MLGLRLPSAECSPNVPSCPAAGSTDRPMSRAAFEARFPDEASCARHLAAKRWPDGFVCPACGHDRGWELKRRRASWECAACGKETSVTAGTIMHRSHLPLKTWLMAVHIVTSHSNGNLRPATPGPARARQLQECLAPAAQAAPRHGRSGIAACLRTWSRSMRPPYRSAP